MATDLELLSATDKPALLAVSQPELLETCRTVLRELNYKVHTAGSREDFLTRFTQIQYEIVLLEELFSAQSLSENLTLQSLQTMPMNLRRQTTTFLIGDSFQTLHPMQAFHQSVHAVINRADMDKLSPIVQKVVADNTLFLNVYRETQLRAAQAKA